MEKNRSSERGFAKLVVAVVLAVVLIGIGAHLYNYANDLRNVGVGQETALSAQYVSNQNYLSAYIAGFYEQVGVANLKSDKMDQILLDAVRGRYESSGGFAPNGAFFSAIVEAYPDVQRSLDVFDKIVDYVQAQREGYRAIQDKLLDMLRVYDRWRGEGIVQSWIIKSWLGVPTDRLVARIGTTEHHGAEAEKKMWQIVLTAQAKEAYERGVMEPLQLPSAKPKTNEGVGPGSGPKPGAETKPGKRSKK